MATLFVWLLVPPVYAATVRGLSLADLVLESDVVLRGNAIRERAFGDPQLGIVRAVEVEVEARLAGTCGDRVEVVLLGGELERTATHVPGEAELSVGEEALLFLSAEPGGRYRVVGMSQGLFRVVRGPEAGQAFAVRELGPLNLIDSPTDDDLGLARACTSTFVPLALLESLVREIASGAGT